MSKPRRLFLVDAMALVFRSFFALGRTPLRTRDGRPTSAVFGSAMFLNKLISEERPDYMAVVLESEKPTFRHEVYKDYKAHRDRMPSEMAVQMPQVFELFERMKLPVLKVEGFEADDVIGSVARRLAGEGLDVFIVSGDKDFLQLVNDHIFLYAPKTNEPVQIFDRQTVVDKFHCPPERVIDCLALIGDTSDNVPGVPGIGEKGAAKLIETYGSLEEIYEHIDDITAKKQKEALLEHRDAAFLSRDLVTINTNVPLDLTLESLRIDPDHCVTNDDLLELYDELEFRQLATKAREARRAGRGSPLDEPKAPVSVAEEPKEVRYGGAELLEPVIAAALSSKWVGLDVEIDQDDPVDCQPRSLSLAAQHGLAARLVLGDGASAKELQEVKDLLANPKIKKRGHGLKTQIEALRNRDIRVAGPLLDAEVMDYLLDPNNNNHSFDACIVRHLGVTRTLDSEMPKDVPADLYRACERADLASRLVARLLPMVEAAGMKRVLEEIEMPLIPVLARMEQAGIKLESEQLAELSGELDRAARDIEKRLYEAAGREFNIGSPKQLQVLLFEELKVHEALGVKRLKRTKTGFSTDESVLTQLSDHPVPRLILEYRMVTKLKNTYVDTLPQHVNRKTGRLHTRFRQTVAATGRLASDTPNLQNIPMRSEMGRKIRKAFVPSQKGYVILSADYSQIEIRLLAHLADATQLIEAFRQGLDIHRLTAAKIFGVREDEVDHVMRSRAKAVNFGIIYGMGPQRLAQDTGVSLSEAREFIDRYFQVYPGIRRFTEGLIDKARTLGYSETITGRRRPIPGIHDRNRAIQARAENIAINAPIQGSAADLIKLAMIAIDRELSVSEYQARMLLQIHDELVFECPEKYVEPVTTIVKERMEGALETKVPLVVDVGVGANWLEAHG